ncbi:MAG: hypothetical protein M3374_01980 [Pseudomonadota bacterium]|nr:hypothetical protein [Pseudomonadota bacterium]
MNKLMALLYFVLALYGCDVGGGTFEHRSTVDGADTLHSKAQTQSGVARFECRASASGRCHYTVFAKDCAVNSQDTRRDRCQSEPVERFALATGATRQIVGLPDFVLCVSAETAAPGTDCKQPGSEAAR